MSPRAGVLLAILTGLASSAAAQTAVHTGPGAYRREQPLSSAQGGRPASLLYGQPQGDKALSSRAGGATSYGANTTTFQDIGPLSYGSDGTWSQTIGAMTYVFGPDGHTVLCQTIANQTYCN